LRFLQRAFHPSVNGIGPIATALRTGKQVIVKDASNTLLSRPYMGRAAPSRKPVELTLFVVVEPIFFNKVFWLTLGEARWVDVLSSTCKALARCRRYDYKDTNKGGTNSPLPRRSGEFVRRSGEFVRKSGEFSRVGGGWGGVTGGGADTGAASTLTRSSSNLSTLSRSSSTGSICGLRDWRKFALSHLIDMAQHMSYVQAQNALFF